jgi:surface antigen
MQFRLLRSGKQPSLPRVKVPYRKLNHRIFPALAWLVLVFVLAGQVLAYGPELIAFIPAVASGQIRTGNVALLMASVKPVSSVKSFSDSVVAKEEPSAPDIASSSVAATPNSDSTATPQISMEIKEAEYIAPPVFDVSGIVLSGGASSFPYGQCTYYVATRRPIPWGGNAGTWYSSAQAMGFKVGKTPAVGAVMVSYEGFSSGHVSYVESVQPDGGFTVSEMNYAGAWGRVTYRSLHLGDVYIVGFIY